MDGIDACCTSEEYLEQVRKKRTFHFSKWNVRSL